MNIASLEETTSIELAYTEEELDRTLQFLLRVVEEAIKNRKDGNRLPLDIAGKAIKVDQLEHQRLMEAKFLKRLDKVDRQADPDPGRW